ncbi:MAG: hypothetical protein AAF589_04690 [Planctomycetota bacterium]
MLRAHAPLALILGLTMAAASPATTLDWSLAKFRGYEQTEDNTAPTTPLFYEFFSHLATDNPADFLEVNLGGAPGSPVPFVNLPGGLNWEISQQFLSEAALDAAYPANAPYSIGAMSALGLINEPVAFGLDFPSTLPFFTGPVFSALQGMNAAVDFTLTWNMPLAADGVNEAFIFVLDAQSGEQVFQSEVTDETSVVLPGGTLLPGSSYIATIEYRRLSKQQRESFANGEEEVRTGNLTAAAFTTSEVPEPTTISTLFAVACGVVATRRMRR